MVIVVVGMLVLAVPDGLLAGGLVPEDYDEVGPI
jgi:hypothetical protein